MMVTMMMMMGVMVMMSMCFQLPLRRLADSRGSALGALFAPTTPAAAG